MDWYFKLWFGWVNFLVPPSREEKKVPCIRTAKYKVTKTKVIESVFFSNADNAEKARDEAWTAFNIYDKRVKSGPKKVDFIVEENPHRTIDDDGYDTVTGLRY